MGSIQKEKNIIDDWLKMDADTIRAGIFGDLKAHDGMMIRVGDNLLQFGRKNIERDESDVEIVSLDDMDEDEESYSYDW